MKEEVDVLKIYINLRNRVYQNQLWKIKIKTINNLFSLYKNNLIDSNVNMYLTVGSMIKINNILSGSNNITLRKVNVFEFAMWIWWNVCRERSNRREALSNDRPIPWKKYTCAVLFNTFQWNTPVLWWKR